jgi:hypothetical protein
MRSIEPADKPSPWSPIHWDGEKETPYLRWRLARWKSRREGFHEATPPVAERLLQQVWHHQRLKRAELRDTQGSWVRVLHPGFWNQEAGPDFTGAIIQFGDSPARHGDVEIDLSNDGWRGHGHADNPAYAKVALHVVWRSRGEETTIPTLELEPHLDAPLSELEFWLGESAPAFPEALRGRCHAPLQRFSDEEVNSLLSQAADARLRYKATTLQAAARQGGWSQALWEGLFSALGYKQNTWPMRRLGELAATLTRDIDHPSPEDRLQARLFGVAGLLPTELPGRGTEAGSEVTRMWEAWWREAASMDELILPKGAWRWSNIRPANHPQRRLALAAHWLARRDLPERLSRWLAASIIDKELSQSLEDILEPPTSHAWRHRFTLQSKPSEMGRKLLGADRLGDVAVNVILPWLWLRALAGRNGRLADTARHRYHAWPAAGGNAVHKLAVERLLGGRKPPVLKRAAGQQGLLQITRDFCARSDSLCHRCEFPDLLAALPLGGTW